MLDVKKMIVIIGIPVIILSIIMYNSITNRNESLVKKYNIVLNDQYDNYVLSRHKVKIDNKKEKVMVIYYYDNDYGFDGFYSLYTEAYIKDKKIVDLHQSGSFYSIEELQSKIDNLENDFNFENIKK